MVGVVIDKLFKEMMQKMQGPQVIVDGNGSGDGSGAEGKRKKDKKTGRA